MLRNLIENHTLGIIVSYVIICCFIDLLLDALLFPIAVVSIIVILGVSALGTQYLIKKDQFLFHIQKEEIKRDK